MHPFPDHELEDMKMKISALKSEIQKEVSRAWHLSWGREVGCFYGGPLNWVCGEVQGGEVVRREHERIGGLWHTCAEGDSDCGR